MKKEIWKDIIGYEGLYQISSFGNVKSVFYSNNIILKPNKQANGYLKIGLFKNGKKNYFLIHRLVAMSFLENKNNAPEVNHTDECKTNNNVENLEWCDRRYNINYGTRNSRMGKSQTNGKKSKKVIQIKNGIIINEFPSASEAERQLGFSQGHISDCCLGKLKTAYKYSWKYSNEA